jgi:heme-degrading monooxygenase HmoA
VTVVRVWKGYGTAEGVERYRREHFAESVLPELRTLDGFLDAHVLVRAVDGETELVVATVWSSFEAIAAFAGEDGERAVVEPVVRGLLTRFDDRVRHYEELSF